MPGDDIHICCILCGVAIANSRQPSDSWIGQARAVGSHRLLSNHFLTGVGYLRVHDDLLLAPRSLEHNIKDLSGENFQEIGPELYDPLRPRDDERCFIFHDRCWSILVSKVRLQVIPKCHPGSCSERCTEKAIAKLLFNYFITLELHEKEYLRSRLNYGGASEFFRPLNTRNFPIRCRSESAANIGDSVPKKKRFLLSDPDDVSGVFCGLQDSETNPYCGISEASNLSPWSYQPLEAKVGGDDIFSKLPKEVIHDVLNFLSSRDIWKLRQASVAISQVATRDQLPQCFWKSRFELGNEMDFMSSPIERFLTSGQTDWRRLYHDVELALNSSTDGLANRARIWRICSYFADAIVPILRCFQHKDAPWLKRRASHLPWDYTLGVHEGPPRDRDPSWATMAGWNTEPHLTSQLLGSQSVIWPCDPVTEPLRLGVSRIKFDDRWFACGLRVRPVSGSAASSVKLTAGVINEEEEEEAVLHPGDKLTKVCVRHCSSGIIGLQFHIQHSSYLGKLSVNWDGYQRSAYAVVRESCLETTKTGHSLAGFNIGLDAFRFESFGLIFKHNGDCIPQMTPYYAREK